MNIQIKIFEEELLDFEEFPDSDTSTPEAILKQILLNIGGTRISSKLMNILMQLLLFSRFGCDKEKQEL